MLQLRTERDLVELLERDAEAMACLLAVRTLGLPQAWVGAGFVRSRVWDALHGFAHPTPLPDIDVPYYDASDLDEAHEKAYDAQLTALHPGPSWSTKNQARMHEKKGVPPYPSAAAAIAEWTETATCVCARIDGAGRVEILAPHGLEDLLAGVVRPTPYARAHMDLFEERRAAKRWIETWPKLRFELD